MNVCHPCGLFSDQHHRALCGIGPRFAIGSPVFCALFQALPQRKGPVPLAVESQSSEPIVGEKDPVQGPQGRLIRVLPSPCHTWHVLIPSFCRCVLVLASLWVLHTRPVPTLAADQAKPLRRAFHPADEWRYRVRLTVRTELEGPATTQTGAGASEKNLQHSAQVNLAWIVCERVLSVTPEGTAHIREQLEKFGPLMSSQPSAAGDEQSAKLAAALERIVSDWARDRTLEFRVGPNGLATQIPEEGTPKLEEFKPLLLTMWLNHALRPQATLPARPVRPGESWQEPRRVNVAEWMAVQAGEKDEWLEAPAAEPPAVRLHVVQQISGRVLGNLTGAPARSEESEEGERKTPPRGSSKTEAFFGESLSTLALDDGRVLAASRSARRETVQELPRVEGTTQPRRSRATLSVQVEIEPCVEKECEAGGNR